MYLFKDWWTRPSFVDKIEDIPARTQVAKIKIDPENPCYSYYDDRYIIGKSTKNADNYDTLVFASRDITIMQKKKLL